MGTGKKLLCLLTAAVLLLSCGGAALAADLPEESLPDEELSDLMDPEELDAMVAEFISQRNINPDNFAVAYCYTGTGETYYFNENRYMAAASTYKLSLMMGLARKVADGELRQDDKINGMDISYIESRSLIYSDNEVSEQMIVYFWNELGSFADYRRMQAEIAGIPAEELPEDYFSSNNTSARFLMGVLKELYGHPDRYPNILECLLAAEPGHYFRTLLEGQYDVAQKYGGGDGIFHSAGIIYTPTPCLLVVMTNHVSNAENVIGEMAKMMADYSLTLDQRRDEILERRAEEERLAAEAAEAERLAAEQAERDRLAEEAAEQARLAAEEEARLAAEQAALAAAPEPEAAAPEPAGDPGPLRAVVIALAAAVVGLAAAAVIRAVTRKKAYR